MEVMETSFFVPMDVSSSDVSADMETTEQIAPSVPTYTGPYSVTPSESSQTLSTQGKKMSSDVSVSAVPSDYVGSAVPRKASADLTQSSSTITAPAGYYAENASKTIANATLQGLTKNIEPTIHVDDDGLVTASGALNTMVLPINTAGYARTTDALQLKVNVSGTAPLSTEAGKTVTPTTSEQTAVTSGKFTTGDIKVGPIPSQYYDMSGALAWLGPGAELVTTLTCPDVKLSATSFASWTPSTTATDILATRTAGTFTAANVEDYDYIMVWNTVIPVEYNSGAVDKARPLFLAAVHIQEIVRRPSSFANIQASLDNNTVHAIGFTAGNFFRYYGSTQGSVTYTWNTSYGFYGTYAAATISSVTATSPTITAKSPKITARCSTTYMSTANAALIDKDKTVIKQSCKVYRVKKPTLIQGAYDEVIKLVNEVSS